MEILIKLVAFFVMTMFIVFLISLFVMIIVTAAAIVVLFIPSVIFIAWLIYTRFKKA